MIWFIIIALNLLLILYINSYNKLYKKYKDEEQRCNATIGCLNDLVDSLNNHFKSNLTVTENDGEIKVIGEIKYLIKDD